MLTDIAICIIQETRCCGLFDFVFRYSTFFQSYLKVNAFVALIETNATLLSL